MNNFRKFKLLQDQSYAQPGTTEAERERNTLDVAKWIELFPQDAHTGDSIIQMPDASFQGRYGSSQPQLGRRTRPFYEPKAKRIAKLEPIAKHRQLAQAVDVVDKVSIQAGKMLFKQPWLRFAFLCYFLLLHLWCMYVLEFHTSEMHDKHFFDSYDSNLKAKLPTPQLPVGFESSGVKPEIDDGL